MTIANRLLARTLTAALICACAPLSAATLIDSFDAAQAVSATPDISATTGPGIIGSSREVVLSDAGGEQPTFTASAGVATIYNGSAASNAAVFLFYDGLADGLVGSPPAGGGLGGVDLLGGELALLFRYDVVALAGSVSLQGGFLNPLSGIFDFYSTTTLTGGVNPPGSYTSGLQVGPAALGNSVDVIAIRVAGLSPGESIALSAIGIGMANEPLPAPVPLPAAALLLAAALPLLGRRRT